MRIFPALTSLCNFEFIFMAPCAGQAQVHSFSAPLRRLCHLCPFGHSCRAFMVNKLLPQRVLLELFLRESLLFTALGAVHCADLSSVNCETTWLQARPPVRRCQGGGQRPSAALFASLSPLPRRHRRERTRDGGPSHALSPNPQYASAFIMPPRTHQAWKVMVLKPESTLPVSKNTSHALVGLPAFVVADQYTSS
jgi:hypothetical protein